MAFCIYSSINDFELFQKGNEQYKLYNFEQSLNIYNQIKSKDGAVWCNMGTAAYELKDYVQALIFWERAKKCRFIFSEITMNKIEKIRQNHDLHAFPEAHRLMYWLELCPIGVVQLLCLMICILFLLLFVRGSINRYRAIACVCAFLGTSGAVWYKYTGENIHTALMTKVGTSLRAGPGEQYHEIMLLDKISYVYLVDTYADWSKVMYNKNIAWIPTQSIEVI